MKRLALAAGTALTYLFVTATAALADSTIVPPGEPPVRGKVITPPGGTAFTGADVTFWLVAIAALVAVGITLLVLSRRRSASVI